MCHADDATPPAPPRSGAVAGAGDLHLAGADGTRLMAYHARPARRPPASADRGVGQVWGRQPGVVVLPDVRGLHRFYKAFAQRLAEAGFPAVAVDYYARELPDGPRDGSMEEMMPLAGGLGPEQVAADARAASDHLRSQGVDTVFTLGFCVGGSHSWIQSAFDHRLAGCVGFYGLPDDARPYMNDMRAPLLLLGAGADVLTPTEDFRAFDEELSAAGVEHSAVLYDGAPHAFFDHSASEHEQACDDAWRCVLDFIDTRTQRHAEVAQ